MCVLRVTSCCCFDLEFGGLIFVYIELVMHIITACNAFVDPYSLAPVWARKFFKFLAKNSGKIHLKSPFVLQS